MSVLRRNQKGAALIAVLLLVASLSFIALAIGEKTALAASRSVNERARSEAIWRAFGAEALAAAALRAAAEESPEVMTLDEPWVERRIDAPMEDGGASLVFADATRCFNINSLVTRSEGGDFIPREGADEELIAMARVLGVNDAEAEAFAATALDWIDVDSFSAQRGREDGFYTALPTPYRTGSTLMADETELRALADVSRELYAALRPYVCALPTTEPAPVNVNMLRPRDAPVLVGLLRDEISLSAAEDVIASRPPGGYQSREAFWSHQVFEGLELGVAARERVALKSRYVAARADIAYGSARVNAAMVFEVHDGGAVRLIARRLGQDV